MAGVFINYRSKDQPLGAAAIHDHLARRFGHGRVFRDCVSMGPGDRYPDELRSALRSADILLAIIGPEWLTMAEGGQRLIDRPFDWVRYEIATAFQQGIQVLPVLLKETPASAGRITKGDLPADISEIASRQAFEFSQRRFGAALDELVARIVELVPTLADVLDVPTPPNAASAATTTMRDVHIAGNGVIGINNGDMR
ncbi:toll/interleukin-1 receptor domain-containing protein [Actinophytocola sp.]|jgi:TIR domain-containing protein|uniref:toll/interleukin-1 receptor domain-containing protein n=1 Tax=Actinophytocola sp. TaxID=1872138 RepID=UPI002D563991|nr:toll/interleukin-1 receptor domain-containing protein [Actinophytocola sp.]HYQ61961.1 toll/interleukin-1 receptor domain-containing protein [Actinophytocola sp.]